MTRVKVHVALAKLLFPVQQPLRSMGVGVGPVAVSL
jgi:hypothetical protein